MSKIPTLKSPFFRYLLANNRPHLDNLKKWVFQPGMLFNSMEKWWGDKGARLVPHEGLDLCSFEEASGRIKTLNRHIKIPAAYAGEIVKIEPDFLGQSIFIGHDHVDNRARRLFSAYGHTVPRDSLAIGSRVREGEIVGAVSGGFAKKNLMLPHLHITFAWIPVAIPVDNLNWDNLSKNTDISLIDPLPLLELSVE